MSRLITTEAIVLKKKELLGSDLIVSLLTESLGKLNVLAKGIKKIKSTRSSHIETGNMIKAVLYKNKDYFYLRETSLITAFSNIKNNQLKTKKLYLVLYFLDRIMPENQKDENVYLISKKNLINLGSTKTKELIDHYADISHIFKTMGYGEIVLTEKNIREKFEEITGENIPPHIL